MATLAEIEAVVLGKVTNPEIRVRFFEGAALFQRNRPDLAGALLAKARRERLRVLGGHLRVRDWRGGFKYACQHGLLTPEQKDKLLRFWVRTELDAQRPWEALKVAREFHLPDLAEEAAHRWSEQILSRPQHEPSALLEIVVWERAGDQEFAKRVAAHSFNYHLQAGDYRKAASIVEKFPRFFSEVQKEALGFAVQACDLYEEKHLADQMGRAQAMRAQQIANQPV